MVHALNAPGDIIGGWRDDLKKILIGYKSVKEKIGWDEYASKISAPLRDTISKLLAECRQNGFFNPQVYDDKIVFSYLAWPKNIKEREDHERRKNLNHCDLCEKECSRKDWKGVFKERTQPCWKNEDIARGY